MTSLTRIYLNPQKRGGRKLLTNPQAMHAAVRAAFPPDLDEEDARVLWRVDQRENTHTLYIVGPEVPDATHIVEQAGWDTRPPQTADYTRMLDSLMLGQRWHFELVANPVKSVAGKRGTRGKTVPHVTPEQQLEWLHTRQEAAGFRLSSSDSEQAPSEQLDAAVIGRRDVRFSRNSGGSGKKGGRVTIRTARFSGNLEVTDVDKLRRTLVHGIGKSRAYGCGLLTLARTGS